MADEIGSTANRYQILAKLAVGGMAEIFLARGASVAGVERYCVLKRILRERASDAQFVQMFVDEVRLAAQLQHPNIASVYDVGVLGDSYFFTMEYVHGETVRSLLERADEQQRPLPLACVLTIIAGAASGLHHAHERNANDGQPLGIVHRDVSPSNLMVSFEGNVKLVDFGVAKADDRSVETRSGTVKGKISYLSPEQCRAERVDRRSDLFSLGIVMWEMLTGKRLYRRANDFDNMTAIATEPPPPPSSRRPEVPRAIDDIVLRLLAKSPANRFQTADQVVEAIENASMLARTILSTSAVSRLVRDLFGHRPEPWLEIEGKAEPYKTVSLASRPIPQDLGLVYPPVNDDDPGLSNVLDLSVHPASAIIEIEDLSVVSEVRAAAPPARPSAVMIRPPALSGSAPPIAAPAAPPSSSATTIPTAATARATSSPPSVPNSTLFDTAPPVPSNVTLRDAAPSISVDNTVRDTAPPVRQSLAAFDIATPTPLNHTLLDSAPPIPVNTTLLGVSAPPPSAAAAVLSAFPSLAVPRTQTAPPRPATAPPGGRVSAELPTSPSGPTPIYDSSPRPVPNLPGFAPWPPDGTLPRTPDLPAPRAVWPLIIVIVVAAAIGVVTVWLSMRPASPRAPQVITDPALLPVRHAAPPDASDTPPRAPLVADPAAGDTGAGDAATSDGSERIIADRAPGQTDDASPEAHELPAGERTSPSDAPLPGPVDTSPPPKVAPPGRDRPSPDSLMALYKKQDYPAIVRICSEAAVNAEITTVCVKSACRKNDVVQAKRWLLASEPAARKQMMIYCKALGLDLARMFDCPQNEPGCRTEP